MNHLETNDSRCEQNPDWEQVRLVLDELVSSLGDTDRDALLHRFFKNEDFRAVGAALGVSDDTAQKRVSRALERLRELMSRRGVVTSTGVLASVISANAVQSAPAGLVGALSGAATVPPAAVAITKLFAMTTLQKSLIGAALAAAVGTGIHRAYRASELNGQLQLLKQQQAPLTEQRRQLQQDLDEAARQLAALRDENARLSSNTGDLLKLRGEVAKLRRESESRATVAVAAPGDPMEAAAQAWVSRLMQLKQRLDQWPGRKTPELQLLSDQDWLNVASEYKLDTEEDCRTAMSKLRWKAMSKFSDAVNQALKEFAAANNQSLPSDPTELAPFLDPAASACVAGWDIAKPGWVHPPRPSSPGSETAAVWAMIEKGSFDAKGSAIHDGSYLADPEYDMTLVIYNGGCYGYGTQRIRK